MQEVITFNLAVKEGSSPNFKGLLALLHTNIKLCAGVQGAQWKQDLA